MKVNIGPFKKFWGPYQIADLLQHVGVSEDKCDNIGRWLHDTWLTSACEYINSVNPRTVSVHIDNYDVWNGMETIASIVHPLLVEFRRQLEEQGSAPMSMPQFQYKSDWQWQQQSFDFYVADDELASSAAEQEWKDRLDKMIFAFEVYKHGSLHNEYDEDVIRRADEGLAFFAQHFSNIWN